MTSKERVLAAFEFRPPDRIPRFDTFWEFPASWAERFGPACDLTDISIWVPDEGAFPTRARVLEETDACVTRIDSWGRTLRRRRDAYFDEVLDVPIPEGVDPDTVQFDPPDLPLRFERGRSETVTSSDLACDKARFCVFGKTGGPFLRTSFVRGEAQFLMDIAGDPPLARALVEKMAGHLIGVARSEIRHWGLQETGVWIYDDMAMNQGPMFSPASFEKVLLPAYRRMVREYKAAGAKYVVLHSDGNILPVLDMLVDAGIDGINPLERRAGMDPAKIRARHPRLVLTGGMCNTDTLRNGPAERIAREARELIEIGRDGGVVIGTHSVSPEIPIANFEVYYRTCLKYGQFQRQ
jgi:uroporphyrinogen-III decarboxylase